jgi:ABC-type Zn uptake system ZnuABC Zn-binding protein ZnuA
MHTNKKLTALIITSVCCILFQGCNSGGNGSSDRLQVLSGIPAYADIVQLVGGPHVDVTTLIPPGKNPHTFDLDPRLMVKIAHADLIVFNGAGLEMWADALVESSMKQSVKVLWASELIKDSLLLEEHHEGHVHAAGVNPHFWLDPLMMRTIVSAIRDSLVSLDPLQAEDFRRNAQRCIDSLEAVDKMIRTQTLRWKNTSFISTHSSWLYFCNRYGLKEAGVIESVPGDEISAKRFASMLEMMRSEGISVIFTQYMFPNSLAISLAEESGATITELDPHGSSETATGYFELLEYNFKQMEKVMR